MSLRESVRALFGEDDLHAGNVEAVSARIRDAIRPGYYRRIIGEVSRIRYCQVNSLEAQVFMETQDPGLVDGLMGGGMPIPSSTMRAAWRPGRGRRPPWDETMNTACFDYELPPELIAQAPQARRDASRMMVVDRAAGAFSHRGVSDLVACVEAGDLIVVNDTRVLPARLVGHWTDSGGRVELLLIEELEACVWETMCRTSRRARPGQAMTLAGGRITGEVQRMLAGGRLAVRLACEGALLDVLEEAGVPPVPPYIKRSDDAARLVALDRERYQTIFARHVGAVAAPTAGLHFTPELMTRLRARGAHVATITLHVGPGTFRPVQCERVEAHVMEAERYELTEPAAEALRATRAGGGRVLAVGSTTVRTLEAVARDHGEIVACRGRTDLFIYPPFAFRVVDRILTNFHLPRSSLLMMMAAFAGDGRPGRATGIELMLAAYRAAVEHRYRFYSYGDCMLIQ